MKPVSMLTTTEETVEKSTNAPSPMELVEATNERFAELGEALTFLREFHVLRKAHAFPANMAQDCDATYLHMLGVVHFRMLAFKDVAEATFASVESLELPKGSDA